MNEVTASTVDTRYVEAAGVQYAYRRFGRAGRTPLLCLQHFTGTLDNWDPLIVDTLSQDREIILFGNAGVGASGGEVPDTIDGMVAHVLRFVDALKLEKLHILGFSLGGFLAQDIAIARPGLVDRLVLSGSAPQGGTGAGMDRPELLAVYIDDLMAPEDKLRRLFFPDTLEGHEAASRFLGRLSARSQGRDSPIGPDVAPRQLKAMVGWANWTGDIRGKLAGIPHPVLVTNGSNDIMIPTANAFELAAGLPDATLIVYPKAGHGALFQYPHAYTSHVATFLEAS